MVCLFACVCVWQNDKRKVNEQFEEVREGEARKHVIVEGGGVRIPSIKKKNH